VSRWSHVIVHHTASPDSPGLEADNIRRYHLSLGWRDVGYHYLVEHLEGGFEAVIGRPAFMAGSHSPGWNSKALGVAFVGNFEDVGPTPAQLDVGAELIASLCYMNEIPIENILGHRDVRATACPGASFSIPELRALVADYLGVPWPHEPILTA